MLSTTAAAGIAIVACAWLGPYRGEYIASTPRQLLLLHEAAERGEAESTELHCDVVEHYAAWARSLARRGRLDAGAELGPSRSVALP